MYYHTKGFFFAINTLDLLATRSTTHPQNSKITIRSLGPRNAEETDARRGRASPPPPPHYLRADETLVLADEIAGGKSSSSASPCPHDRRPAHRENANQQKKSPPREGGRSRPPRQLHEPAGLLHLHRKLPKLHDEAGAILAIAEKEPGNKSSTA